jgi:acyl carrier protein
MTSPNASPSPHDASPSPRDASSSPRDASSVDIEGWLLHRLQSRLGPGAEVVDRYMPFSYYGLDSIAAVELAAELEDWLGRPVSATLTFDYPTVSAVATYLAAKSVSAPLPVAADVSALLTELGVAPPDRMSS